MSNGNMLLGQARKKLGSVVFYVKNGQQVQRVWTDSGARRGKDASYATRAQRVQFGEAANEWIPYKYLCTRMYRSGKKPSESDYNMFTKYNWRYYPYLTKEMMAHGIYTLVPGTYSKGNLGDNYVWYWWTHNTEQKIFNINVGSFDVAYQGTLPWTSTVNELKDALQLAYPNADKVVYALGYLTPMGFSDDTGIYRFDSITWYPVIVKLTGKNTQDDATSTIKDLFNTQLANTPLDGMGTLQSGNFINKNSLFNWTIDENEEGVERYDMFATIFATNDTANDCYSTILRPGNYTPGSTPWAIYNLYRTKAAFRAACESYGFSSSVMQTDVNIYGRDNEAEVAAYIKALYKSNQPYAARAKQICEQYGCDVFYDDVKTLDALMCAADDTAAHSRQTSKSGKQAKEG